MHSQASLWTKFIKHSVETNRVASLHPALLCTLHFAKEMVSFVDKGNINTVVKTLG